MALAGLGLWSSTAAAHPAAQPVVSQIYGGGGNAGAPYQTDFIELFNRSGAPADLTGYSVQYASSASGLWSVTPVSGTLAIGQYLLVAEAGSGGGGATLPAPDAIGNTDLNATSGKVALVASFVPLTGACPSGPTVVDLVGYGTAATCFRGAGPAPNASNTASATRKAAGCTDTDSNSADFQALAPGPRDTLSARNLCSPIPAAPTFAASDPPSPSNNTTPNVLGSAGAGTTVELYANPGCTGTPAATGSAALFGASGIAVSVPVGYTTTFHALAYDATNTSVCSSGSLTYAASEPAPSPAPAPAPPTPSPLPASAVSPEPAVAVASTTASVLGRTGVGRVVWHGRAYPNLRTVARRSGVPAGNLAPLRTGRRRWIARVV